MNRTMTRSQYHRERAFAFRAERDAALLAGSQWHKTDAALAKRLRAEIAPPVDTEESSRNIRWAGLRIMIAARLTKRARELQFQARRLTA